jgi:hypothetical protein
LQFTKRKINAIWQIIKIPLYSDFFAIKKTATIIAILQIAIYKNGHIIAILQIRKSPMYGIFAIYKNGHIIAILQLI